MKSSQDLPLKNDIAARFLPVIVGLMVYLGTLCFVFTLFLFQSSLLWEQQFTTHLTIEIPTPPHTSSAILQARVLQLLNKTPGIGQASAVPQKEIEKLLHSLMGSAVSIDSESLPTLIDVSLNGKELVDTVNLEAHLKAISPEIQLIDDRNWQGQVSNLVSVTVILAFTLTFLILMAAMITTTFATRTSLLIHRQVIEILHLIGATNTYIAKQFQIHALKQGLMASTLGSFIGFLTFGLVLTLLEKAGFGFEPSFFTQALCVFALAPFLTGFFMMLSARMTVMRGLQP
jgi:cell division transport system permease protein